MVEPDLKVFWKKIEEVKSLVKILESKWHAGIKPVY
jgi:hypothetical protein